MDLVVVRIREWLNKLVPVPLMIGNVMSQTRGECLIVSFGLAVGLGMIRSRRLPSDTHNMANCFEKFGYELRSIIRQDRIRYSVAKYPIV